METNRPQLSDAQKREIIKRRKKKKRNRKILFWTAEIILGIVVAVCAISLNLLGRIGQGYYEVNESDLYKPSYGTSSANQGGNSAGEIDITTAIADITGGETVTPVTITPVTQPPTNPSTSDKEYTTIAIFGVDCRTSEGIGIIDAGANSDVLMVATIHNPTGGIRLISVYRDTLLKDFNTGKYDKANAAYAKNGYLDAINTLALNLDVSFDYFVCIDWKAAIEIIGVLGGVDVEMKACYKQIKSADSPTGYVPYLNGLINEIVAETGIGTVPIPDEAFVDGLIYHLDGVQAVAYMRMRKTDSDFNRTQRQREVMTQALQLAKQSSLSTLLAILDIVGNNVVFNIGQDDLLGMISNITNYEVVTSLGYPIHLYDGSGYTGSMRYNIVPIDVVANVTAIHQALYPSQEYYPSEELLKINEEIRALGQFDENWVLQLQQ